MYIPKAFVFDDQAEKIAFMKQYSFAAIVTNIDSTPVATMLPFVINERDGKIFLQAHFSAVNEQAKYIENNTSLVIFSGPHAYISPEHYDKRESVPTWNYITVHAHGRSTILHDDVSKKMILEEMIAFYDSGYKEQWDDLPEKYIAGMLKGIVAFELEVSSLTGQKKLSQNKNQQERNKIIHQLERSNNSIEKELAVYIKELP